MVKISKKYMKVKIKEFMLKVASESHIETDESNCVQIMQKVITMQNAPLMYEYICNLAKFV